MMGNSGSTSFMECGYPPVTTPLQILTAMLLNPGSTLDSLGELSNIPKPLPHLDAEN